MTTRTKIAAVLYGTAALFCAASLLAGCMADRYIPVSVPKGIQTECRTGPSVPLREAPQVRERYALQVKQNVASLDASIEDAMIIMSLISTGTDMGITALQGVAPTVPGGALIVGGLTTLGALFTRRPGDKPNADVMKEKEASYAKGAKDAEARLKDQLMSLGVRLGERAAERVVDKTVDKVMGDKA